MQSRAAAFKWDASVTGSHDRVSSACGCAGKLEGGEIREWEESEVRLWTESRRLSSDRSTLQWWFWIFLLHHEACRDRRILFFFKTHEYSRPRKTAPPQFLFFPCFPRSLTVWIFLQLARSDSYLRQLQRHITNARRLNWKNLWRRPAGRYSLNWRGEKKKKVDVQQWGQSQIPGGNVAPLGRRRTLFHTFTRWDEREPDACLNVPSGHVGYKLKQAARTYVKSAAVCLKALV